MKSATQIGWGISFRKKGVSQNGIKLLVWTKHLCSRTIKKSTMKTIFTTVLMLTASIFSEIKAQIHPSDGLVEYFSFNNTLAGSEGALMLAQTSNFSTGYLDDANGAYSINVPNNKLRSNAAIPGFPTGNEELTVCFWVKLNSNSTASLFNYRGWAGAQTTPNLFGTAFTYENNQLILVRIADGNFQEAAGINYVYNSDWNHIALVHFENGDNVVYLDGASIGTTSLNLSSPDDFGSSNLQIGQSPGGQHFGDFEIDEFLIYDRTLSPDEIITLATISVGLDENLTRQINLYPNPTKDVLTLQNIEVGSTINIVDVAGKTVYSKSANNNATEINVSEFVSGMYFVQVSNQGVLMGTHKLQVQ